MNVRCAIIKNALHCGVVYQQRVARLAHCGNGIPVFNPKDGARRHRRAHQESCAKFFGTYSCKPIEIESPDPIDFAQLRVDGNATAEHDAIGQAKVGWLGDEYAIAGLDERKQCVEDTAKAASRDETFGVPIVRYAA